MKTHSMDLRERVIAAVDNKEGSQREIARRYKVSLSFIVRLLQHRRNTGGLEPSPHGGGRKRALDYRDRLRLGQLIREHPDATLEQIRDLGSFHCCLPTLWRTLRRMGFTRKKKAMQAAERDRPDVQKKRARYRRQVRKIDAKRLVFLDETGLSTTLTPGYAWSPRGERAVGKAPASWRKSTCLAAISWRRVLAPWAFEGSLNQGRFAEYVKDVLAPQLRPGQIVVLDNLRVHKSEEALAAIRRTGASVLWLPPYSPDYNPIEEMFSKLKNRMRRAAARTVEAVHDALVGALDTIRFTDLLGYFRHSGLYAFQ